MIKILASILLMFLIALQFLHYKNLVGQNVGLEWAVNFGGNSPESGFGLAVDQYGNVVTAGSFGTPLILTLGLNYII